MGASREEKLVRQLLAKHGELIRRANHGEIWRLPNGVTFMAPIRRGQSLDPRAWKNNLVRLRRALGEA